MQNEHKASRTFFMKAYKVAEMGNFDYAIEMYLEGLRISPDVVPEGHAALREVALKRKMSGGKGPSLKDKMTRKGGKTPLDEMLNAEFLLAKDPENLTYAIKMLKAAVKGSFYPAAKWIAQLTSEALMQSDDSSMAYLRDVRDAYSKMRMYDEAYKLAAYMASLRPEDAKLADEMKFFAAHATMERGKYDTEGDFRNSIQDKEKQDELHQSDSSVKSIDYRIQLLQQAREDYEKKPEEQGVRIKLARALAGIDTPETFEEFTELLEGWYKSSSDFSYKRLLGELTIQYYKNRLKEVRKQAAAQPEDVELKVQADRVLTKLAEVELEHYRLCSENYPTDLKIKYSYGTRLLLSGEFDAAIPLLQQARKDPSLKINAMSKIGICFFRKGWYNDAADVFQQAMKEHEISDDELGKELRYNYAKSCELNNQKDEALSFYRKIAQIDFNYKDVRERIEELIKETSQS
jgi:tetratricopeptide (TPR) repeat protein